MDTLIKTNNTLAGVKYRSGGSIVFSAILATAVFVFQILNITGVVSLCFYISIILIAVNYLFNILATNEMSVYVLIICVLMLFSFATSGFVLDFEVYKCAIIVLCCIICIDSSRTQNLNLKQFRIIEFCSIFAIAFANFAFYLGGYGSKFFLDTNSVAMNFTNPNALALWLTAFFIALLICFFVESHKFLKILLLISAISTLPLIAATESRNSLFSCGLVIASYAIVGLTSKKRYVKGLPHWVLFTLTALPFIVFFVYMYVILPNIDFFENFFSAFVGAGKSLSSRAHIWQIVINYMPQCFFFGKYNLFYNSQMHNSLMTLYCMFGAPITFLISSVFYNAIKRKNIYSQIALLGIWSTGCFEASIFVGVAGIYLMLQILPALGEFTQKKRNR